jgi:hypothetical protein
MHIYDLQLHHHDRVSNLLWSNKKQRYCSLCFKAIVVFQIVCLANLWKRQLKVHQRARLFGKSGRDRFPFQWIEDDCKPQPIVCISHSKESCLLRSVNKALRIFAWVRLLLVIYKGTNKL